MTFSFSFSGDDIEEDPQRASPPSADPGVGNSTPASSSTHFSTTAGAFPVQGKPLLPPLPHDLDQLLARLPSKIAFSLLNVDLEDGSNNSNNGQRQLALPRRELWDVRVQLMAEDDDPSTAVAGNESSDASEARAGLGQHDVKTGIYEGGFKSWESSVDLVKVLAQENVAEGWLSRGPCVVVELGCGTALPSLALFTWALNRPVPAQPLTLVLADYNPSVLSLVTLPNLILAWAHQQRPTNPLVAEAFTPDGEELELTPDLLAAFRASLAERQITLSFLSGAWSPEFVDLLYATATTTTSSSSSHPSDPATATLILGSETIYSPFALSSFSATLLAILQRERRDRPGGQARAVVAAKRLYFGVGGSLDDFVDAMRGMGVDVRMLREETQGVRRGVVECLLS